MFNKNDISDMIDRRIHRLKGVTVKSMVDSCMRRDDGRVHYEYTYKINSIRGPRTSTYETLYPLYMNRLYGEFPNSFSQTLRMNVSANYLDKDQKQLRGYNGVHAFFMVLSMSFVDDTSDDTVIAMRQRVREFKLRGF